MKSALRCGEIEQNVKKIQVDKKLDNSARFEVNVLKMHTNVLGMSGHVSHNFGFNTLIWHKMVEF